MSAPAAAVPKAGTGRVFLEISGELVTDLLRLPDGTSLAGAEVVHHQGTRLVLHLVMPAAPPGANEVCPEYERDTAHPDPVRLTGLTWRRNGVEVAHSRPADD